MQPIIAKTSGLLAEPGFNTASGRYCCNLYNCPIRGNWNVHVSIPQAVGTVATNLNFQKIISGKSSLVSIPQAVGTVATGEYVFFNKGLSAVSIPQAVGTVAT